MNSSESQHENGQLPPRLCQQRLRVVPGHSGAAGHTDWLAALESQPFAPEQGQRLVVYCAVGLKSPVQAAALEYERDFGVQVQLQFGGRRRSW